MDGDYLSGPNVITSAFIREECWKARQKWGFEDAILLALKMKEEERGQESRNAGGL